MAVTVAFQGQDDAEWLKQYKKLILHTKISRIRSLEVLNLFLVLKTASYGQGRLGKAEIP